MYIADEYLQKEYQTNWERILFSEEGDYANVVKYSDYKDKLLGALAIVRGDEMNKIAAELTYDKDTVDAYLKDMLTDIGLDENVSSTKRQDVRDLKLYMQHQLSKIVQDSLRLGNVIKAPQSKSDLSNKALCWSVGIKDADDEYSSDFVRNSIYEHLEFMRKMLERQHVLLLEFMRYAGMVPPLHKKSHGKKETRPLYIVLEQHRAVLSSKFNHNTTYSSITRLNAYVATFEEVTGIKLDLQEESKSFIEKALVEKPASATGFGSKRKKPSKSLYPFADDVDDSEAETEY